MKIKHSELKKARIENCLSVQQIANKLGINRRTYYNWENGRSLPKEARIREIAIILNIPINIISTIKEESDINFLKNNLLPANRIRSHFEIEKNINNFDCINEKLAEIKQVFELSIYTIKSFFSSVDFSIYIKNINQQYIITNEAFLRSCSLSCSTKVINKTDFSFYSKRDAQANIEEDRMVLLSKKNISFAKCIIPGTRNKKHGLKSKYCIFDKNGNNIGLIGCFFEV